ncbi:hypothetical protein PL10110_290026 [Planktothrix agardhii]|nr:hypothetical protein PL10110_290026 [Planktothrix agardhii]
MIIVKFSGNFDYNQKRGRRIYDNISAFILIDFYVKIEDSCFEY